MANTPRMRVYAHIAADRQIIGGMHFIDGTLYVLAINVRLWQVICSG